LSTLSAPGAPAVTITGSGTLDATTALSGFTSVTATGYTGDISTGTVTSGYAGSTITGDSTNGTTIVLGSGNDAINFTSAGTKASTALLGAGNDTLVLNAAGTGVMTVQAGAGDDKIRLLTTALDANDLIDGGDGTDTVDIKGAVAHTMVLKDVEVLTLQSDATGVTTTISASNKALAVTANVNGTTLNLAGLSAGSTVTTKAASDATTTTVSDVTVGFASTEAANTINISSGTTGVVTTSKITAVTVNLGAASVQAGATGFTTTDTATSLTVNATGSLTGGKDITSGDNKLASVTVAGTGAITLGNLTSSGATTTSMTAATNLSVGTQSGSTKLSNVSLTATSGTLDYGSVGSATVTNLAAVNLNAGTTLGAGTAGTIDGLIIGGISATAGTSATLGAIGTAVAVQTIGNINVSGGTTATVGALGNNTDDVFADINITATKGLLTAGALLAKTLGTVTETATAGGIASGNITTADTTGITVNQSASTFINSNGLANGTAITVQNTASTGGGITASLAGAAAATINYTNVTSGVTNLTATNTGGLTSTITNAATAGDGKVSTISLGNAVSTATNTITVNGVVDTLNVTGGTGADVLNFSTGNVFKGGTFAMGSGTDTVDFSGMVGAGLTLGNTATVGIAVNLSNSAVTFDSGQTYTSSLGAGIAAQYQTTTATSKAIVASGPSFTLSGVEKLIGTSSTDYLVASNTGNTITGGGAADKIYLGAGSDTVIFNTTVSSDTVYSFQSGSAKDIASISIGGIAASKAAATNSAAVAAGDTVVIQELSQAATQTAGANVFVLVGTTYTAAQAEAAIEAGGNRALTALGATAATDNFMVAWSDGTHSYLGVYDCSGVTAASAALVANNGTLVTIATLDSINVSVAGTLHTSNFSFVA